MTERRHNNRDRLLHLLADRDVHDSLECARVAGLRFGARLLELREAAYQIETVRLGNDLFGYRLVAEPGETLPVVDHHGQCLLFPEPVAA